MSEVELLASAITWALTWAAGRWALPERYRPALIPFALALASGIMAGAAAVEGQPLTADVLVQGFQVAAAAVISHSGLREVQKVVQRRRRGEEPTTDPG